MDFFFVGAFYFIVMEERKMFKFYRSYYEIYKELPANDKILFMDALLEKQFNNIDPVKLTGLAKFAYISQKQNIDSQIKGFIDKTGFEFPETIDIKAIDIATLPPIEPPIEPPMQESKEKKSKVKEKVKESNEKIIPEFSEFLEYAISQKPLVDKIQLEFKYKSWVENGWRDGYDKEIKNWKSKLLNTLSYISETKSDYSSDKNRVSGHPAGKRL